MEGKAPSQIVKCTSDKNKNIAITSQKTSRELNTQSMTLTEQHELLDVTDDFKG